jgi:protein phosphatase
VVSDETLADTLAHYRDPRECADRMIELALRGGGPDNITCIVADVVDIDFGDDAPIMGGSVGDGTDDGPRPDSAAARASATTMTRTIPQRVEPATPAPTRRRSPPRIALAVVGVLVVLGGAGVLAQMWVLQQYYVGADDGQVTIFQGVRGEVLGVPLHRASRQTDIALSDLPETERSTVREGIISTDGLVGANGLVDKLRDRRLPVCPPPVGATPTPTPAAPTPTTAPAVPPAAGVPVVPAVPTVETTPLPTPTPTPGITCRSVS